VERVFRSGGGTVCVELDRFEASRLADTIRSADAFANEFAGAIVHVLDEDEETRRSSDYSSLKEPSGARMKSSETMLRTIPGFGSQMSTMTRSGPDLPPSQNTCVSPISSRPVRLSTL
jgi:hypothetical protein